MTSPLPDHLAMNRGKKTSAYTGPCVRYTYGAYHPQ